MLVKFSDSDIKSSKIVTPAWYLVQIDEVEDRASSDGKSMNSWIKGHIIKNDDTGDEAFAGVPTPYLWLINSKGAFAAVGLFNSVFGEEVKPDDRRDTAALASRKVVVFIGNGMWKENVVNTITGQYRSAKSE